MTKEINPLIIIGIIIAVALLYQYSSLGALYGTGYKVYANPTTIISETNEYVEYQIPFSILHGNLMGSCSIGTNFDISFITYPSPSYFDARGIGGSEMTLPASSPIKNTNIELNREFTSEVSGISASAVWNPCADTTTNVNVIPYVNSICKVKDYTDDKQNIECKVYGYFNGISGSSLPGVPANTEIPSGALKIISFSGGTIKVKMYKIGFPIIQNKTYYRFSNNLCSQISIQELEKTSNDYDSLEECQSKIQYFNQTQTNQTNQTSQNNSVCTESSKCIGFYYYECQNNSWIYRGNIVGKCGYTTSSLTTSSSTTEEKCYEYLETCQEVLCNEARSQYKSLEFCQATNQPEESFFDKYKWIILGLIILGGIILATRKK